MMEHFREALKRQVKITIITRPADEFKRDRRTALENLLSFGYSEESIMRLESSSIAHELIQSIEMGK